MVKTPETNIINTEDETASFVSDNNADMIDWWGGTVVLTFFPILSSIIISLFFYGRIDMNRMIGDGELVLSAFLVTAPTIINYYRANSVKKSQGHKAIFYLLLFSAFFQLIAYTSIKISTANDAHITYMTSILCVLSSVIIAWQGEKILIRGKNK